MSRNKCVIKRFDRPSGHETGRTLMKKATEETLMRRGDVEDSSPDTILRMHLRRLSSENSHRSGVEGIAVDRALSPNMATGHKSCKLTKVCKTGNHSSTKDRNSGTARFKYRKNSQIRTKICLSCMRKMLSKSNTTS
ncbi:GL20237 [Drosophila persimilis]|uniref:GL20237 n=1 Tax=Drosophila persimilis TaxID=7234 RepID=B4GXN7_DROPE|nr:uncharacterized protein LOC6598224 [Drosophila persimilis]EDW27514.1 GL20237 [Drosophila persimilis]